MQPSVKIAFEVARPEEMPVYALVPELQRRCNAARKWLKHVEVAQDYMCTAHVAYLVLCDGRENLTSEDRKVLLKQTFAKGW